jgi:hypothetical protein
MCKCFRLGLPCIPHNRHVLYLILVGILDLVEQFVHFRLEFRLLLLSPVMWPHERNKR